MTDSLRAKDHIIVAQIPVEELGKQIKEAMVEAARMAHRPYCQRCGMPHDPGRCRRAT